MNRVKTNTRPRKAIPSDPMTVAKIVAPEDIRCGSYVAILRETHEAPSFMWCVDATVLPLAETVRIEYLPRPAGIPLRVESICLPFLLVRRPNGSYETLDVRRVQLAELSSRFARTTWKRLKAEGTNLSA